MHIFKFSRVFPVRTYKAISSNSIRIKNCCSVRNLIQIAAPAISLAFGPQPSLSQTIDAKQAERTHFLVETPESLASPFWQDSFRRWTTYIRAESGNQYQFHTSDEACSLRSSKNEIQICILHTPLSKEEGRAIRNRKSWQIEVPNELFLAHELGHTLGLSDSYDRTSDPDQRRTEFLMDWIDGRPNSISLKNLRELGWTAFQQRSEDEYTKTLHVGDQWSMCHLDECLYLGLHNRLTSQGSAERLRFVATFGSPDFEKKIFERRVDQQGTRGRWDFPQALQKSRSTEAAYIEWDYIPFPVPRVQLQIMGEIRQSYIPILPSPVDTEKQKKAPTVWQWMLFGMGLFFLVLGGRSLRSRN